MLHGLYAITDSNLSGAEQLVEDVEKALLGGASMIQYRDKHSERVIREATASQLLNLCRASGSLLIINDDIDLALKVNADGVHLGQNDAAIAEAKERLGPGKLVGASCYDQLQLACQAQAAGADYVAFGRFYPSLTKPEAVQAKPDLLVQARRELGLPLVAIGGITAENGAPLIAAGADMLAVIQGVFSQADILRASREISALFD